MQHTSFSLYWSSDVCSSYLNRPSTLPERLGCQVAEVFRSRDLADRQAIAVVNDTRRNFLGEQDRRAAKACLAARHVSPSETGILYQLLVERVALRSGHVIGKLGAQVERVLVHVVEVIAPDHDFMGIRPKTLTHVAAAGVTFLKPAALKRLLDASLVQPQLARGLDLLRRKLDVLGERY